ncbi:YopX family protein [Enterococcus casseliflavus]|uniref:YopX family protein n=1 Tax=Enterococcus casseliflavus TaxID=37734 RepID=UPI0039A4D954
MAPKFRGKRKDNGEWVVGVPIPNSFCNVVHMIPILLTDKVAYPTERLHEYLIEIVPETLGQSTGLKDKNGVEIFEGDILKCTSGIYTNLGATGTGEYEETIKQVIWKDDSWGTRVISSNLTSKGAEKSGLVISAKYAEVAGNIYENPELLEQVDEN